MGNIRDEGAFDPFPRDGLTRTFAPFIRKKVGRYCDCYPHVDRQAMLIEAVRLSVLAEAKFDPALGNSFATYVAHRLKELHRFAERYDGSQKFRVVEDPEVKAARLADERGGDPRPTAFKGGGNATRLRFDWQWSVGDLVKRFRLVFGLQAGAGTNAGELADRLGGAREVLPNQRPTDRLKAYVAAAADHLHRRQGEADSEAEKRAAGDHSPTFLEAGQVTDVQFPRAKKPPRFDPEYASVLRLENAVGLDDSGHRLTWQEIIAAETATPTGDPVKAIEAARPAMTHVEKIAADVAIETVRGKPFDLATLASRLGMQKSGASKVMQRMLAKVAGKEGNQWI